MVDPVALRSRGVQTDDEGDVKGEVREASRAEGELRTRVGSCRLKED